VRNSKLAIETDGTITAIYDDELADLVALGNGSIRRVSDVEPDTLGGWTAFIRSNEPAGGPYSQALGSFRLRSEALAAEVAYLETKLF
jgi:hypothetical protein